MKPAKQLTTAPMPQTPKTKEQLADQAKMEAQINKCRPAYTQGAGKGK